MNLSWKVRSMKFKASWIALVSAEKIEEPSGRRLVKVMPGQTAAAADLSSLLEPSV